MNQNERKTVMRRMVLLIAVAALVMGLIVSPVCYLAISHLKTKFGYDDALDAFG